MRPHQSEVLRIAAYRCAPALAVAMLSTALASGAQAAYPDRPIVFVVAYAPGGGTDTAARALARGLSTQLKQSIIVENRPGAGGTIGAGQVQRAAPDGYTFLFADPAFVINTGLMPNVGYNLKTDFTPVSTVTMSPLVLSVHPALPVKDIAALDELARTKPGGLSYSSAGIGTTPHMAGEMLRFATKAPFTHIPYKGSGPAMSNLVAGQLDFSFSTIAAAKPFIQQKMIKAIATTGPTRSAEFPDVPAIAETIPGYQVLFWTALFAPAKTPPAIIDAMNTAVRNALADPETKATIERSGDTATYLPTEKVGGFVDDELRRWNSLVKEANIRPE